MKKLFCLSLVPLSQLFVLPHTSMLLPLVHLKKTTKRPYPRKIDSQ